MSETDDCILWPYADFGGNGYPQLRLGGRTLRVHAEVCRRIHGERPTRRHQAAHSCRVTRCINARHLRWATPKQNEDDKRAHGTHNHAGEKNPRAKLSAQDVAAIRERHQPRRNTQALAAEFGVSDTTIRHIATGVTWAPED